MCRSASLSSEGTARSATETPIDQLIREFTVIAPFRPVKVNVTSITRLDHGSLETDPPITIAPFEHGIVIILTLPGESVAAVLPEQMS